MSHRLSEFKSACGHLLTALSAEVPFVLFDTFELTGSEVALGAHMATAWTNFAATGDPNLAVSVGPSSDNKATMSGDMHMQRRRAQMMDEGGMLPTQCSGYYGLSGIPATRLNGTVQQTLDGVVSSGACCKACSHLFYNQICQGWRYNSAKATCELLSGNVVVANSTISTAAT